MGAGAYRLIERVDPLPDEIVVEIGADRGEGSTGFLRSWSEAHGVKFFSVDIDPERNPDIVADGAIWLEKVESYICFAYLDNFDFIYDEIAQEPWVRQYIKSYSDLGLELTNKNSMLTHLAQARFIHKRSRIGSMIVFDDTWASASGYHGKGAWAVPWLTHHDWIVELACGEKWEGFFALRRCP